MRTNPLSTHSIGVSWLQYQTATHWAHFPPTIFHTFYIINQKMYGNKTFVQLTAYKHLTPCWRMESNVAFKWGFLGSVASTSNDADL